MKIVTGVGGWPGGVGAQAQAAEASGYDCITCGELSHDSIVTMTVAALATTKIDLQTSITIAFPRSPLVLAMEALGSATPVKRSLLHWLGKPSEGTQRTTFWRDLDRTRAENARVHSDDACGLGFLAARNKA